MDLTLEWQKGGECAGRVVQAEGTAHAKVLGQHQDWHVAGVVCGCSRVNEGGDRKEVRAEREREQLVQDLVNLGKEFDFYSELLRGFK